MKIPTYNHSAPWTSGGWVKPTPLELEAVKKYLGFNKGDYTDVFGKAYITLSSMTFPEWVMLLHAAGLTLPPFTDCPSMHRRSLRYADIISRTKVRAATIAGLTLSTGGLMPGCDAPEVQESLVVQEAAPIDYSSVSVEEHVLEHMTEFEKMELREQKKAAEVEEDIISDQELLSFL